MLPSRLSIVHTGHGGDSSMSYDDEESLMSPVRAWSLYNSPVEQHLIAALPLLLFQGGATSRMGRAIPESGRTSGVGAELDRPPVTSIGRRDSM